MGMDHYCLACAFAVNPARKRAPTGFGVDRSALPSKEGFHAKNAKLVTAHPGEDVAPCRVARIASKAWIPCLAAVATLERTAA